MLSLALAVTSLLVGQPASPLPAGHPDVAQKPAAPAPAGAALPQGHPPTLSTSAPSAEALLRQLDGTPGLRDKEKTFEVAANIAKLYYSAGRARDALTYFEQAEARAGELKALFAAERKKAGAREVPAVALASCGLTEETPLAARAAVVKGRGAACVRAALEPVLDTQALHGNAVMLQGQYGRALALYGGVLEVDSTHEDALFGHSSVLYETRSDDKGALKEALAGFKLYVKTYPQSPRARLAHRLVPQLEEAQRLGGMTALTRSRAEDRRIRLSQPAAPADGPPALTKDMVDAVQNTERTPELEAGLAKLVEEGEEHLARGRYQDALAAYTRVVPFQPGNGRAKAGMAWALVGLGRPMADRVWGVAVSSDPGAVEKLGDTLHAKNDAKGARALWSKLAASAPDYPGRAGLTAKLQ